MPLGSLDLARLAVNGPRRVESCACGGRINASRLFPEAEVRAHVRSRPHQAWWGRVRTCWHPWESEDEERDQ